MSRLSLKLMRMGWFVRRDFSTLFNTVKTFLPNVPNPSPSMDPETKVTKLNDIVNLFHALETFS